MSEFEAYMAGFAEYGDLTPAGQAEVDQYMVEYWAYIDHLVEGSWA